MENRSILKIKYRLAAEWRQEQFVETGQMPEIVQTSYLDLTAATPEQRRKIFRVAGEKLEIDWSAAFDYPEYHGQPTIEQITADCERLAIKADERDRKRLNDRAATAIRTIQDLIKRQAPEIEQYHKMSDADMQRAKELGVDLGAYLAALADYEEQQPEFRRLAEEAKQRREKAQAEEAERMRKIQEKREAEKRAWIEAHGSEYLRRACLKGGYDCQRRYIIERAAMEAPGYTVDFDDAAAWRSRSCPSAAALDEEDAARALGLGEPEIVWLTNPPKDSHDDDDDYFEFSPCEAVAIRGYLGKYDLVKIIE